MARSAIKPEHRRQMHELREWARKQGKTPPAITNQEREQRKNSVMSPSDTSTPLADPTTAASAGIISDEPAGS